MGYSERFLTVLSYFVIINHGNVMVFRAPFFVFMPNTHAEPAARQTACHTTELSALCCCCTWKPINNALVEAAACHVFSSYLVLQQCCWLVSVWLSGLLPDYRNAASRLFPPVRTLLCWVDMGYFLGWMRETGEETLCVVDQWLSCVCMKGLTNITGLCSASPGMWRRVSSIDHIIFFYKLICCETNCGLLRVWFQQQVWC